MSENVGQPPIAEAEVQQPVNERYEVPERLADGKAHVSSIEQYKKDHAASLTEDTFWAEKATEFLDWFRPFDQVQSGGFEHGDVAWFLNGKLNVAYNCVDRHAAKSPEKVALVFESDDPKDARNITYAELLREVCRVANVLKAHGVRKGDRVVIYMPMIPQTVYTMLACTRIGAVHSVVFAGFSAEALRDRIADCGSAIVVTADQGLRGGRPIQLKQLTDNAIHGLENPSQVKTVLVARHTAGEVAFSAPRDVWLEDAMEQVPPYCPCETMDSEDTMFLLYTSGSTGKPKGMVHTTAGYLLYTALTHKYVFDYREGDVYACVADVGWITGHSYIVYGPLCNGATTVLFESTPLFPDAGRYWEMVARHKINSFYTAPTAIRLLMKYGDEFVTKHDRSSLRVLGSVGEPINPSAWRWYYNVVGEGKAAIVDTYWQTESGGHLLTPLPGATVTKPGSATLGFYGIDAVLLDQITGQPIPQSKDGMTKGLLAVAKPWPSIARTVYGDHQRYLKTYFKPYPGYYFTGDSATRDTDGYIWVIGRVDDVVNVSGHRMGTAELESALVQHESCSEAAVIAIPHDIKGHAIYAFCVLKEGYSETIEVATVLKLQGLPKTRSGKIMRRILRKLASGEGDQLGDISTCADESVVGDLKESLAIALKWKSARK